MAEKQPFEWKTSIKLPNYEVKSELEKKLVIYFKKVYNISYKLFDNATNSLQLLLHDRNLDTNDLKSSLKNLFEAFPKFINIKTNTEEAGVHGNEDLIHSTINYIALQIKTISKFGTEVWFKNKGRADIILINDKAKLGIIIELKYGGSAKDALSQTNKYISIFEKHKNIKMIKSLGINVSQDKKVEIETKLEVRK